MLWEDKIWFRLMGHYQSSKGKVLCKVKSPQEIYGRKGTCLDNYPIMEEKWERATGTTRVSYRRKLFRGIFREGFRERKDYDQRICGARNAVGNVAGTKRQRAKEEDRRVALVVRHPATVLR
ncbi:hypothetical protein D8674_037261 [Pyrus ussuriensis x Pyrus communis]|uniref:Uncharacterized protein n=1 Tax=Pyrus ussuriensis x Pyrus communis TaxID=2448454 RepID=A0A5N5G7L6_9ROSA|nr:hypothetical protein D8674_037261 [Pyrus ussuriensis x Pyrus communis]